MNQIVASATEKMPVLFLGHGSPMNALRENAFVAEFRNIEKTIPRPRAIVCISAHWETAGTFVTTAQNPKTIHDFGGFPQELYNIEYKAPGCPDVAKEIQSLIKKTPVGFDDTWGLDHGAWSVLMHMYPKADVPVMQMSLDYTQPPQYHYDIAQELKVLRERGVLILGSGNMVHNLGLVAWHMMDVDAFGFKWAIEANDTMKTYIQNYDHQALIDFRSQGSAFDLAIPTPEHYLPLLYVLALTEKDERITTFNDAIVGGSLAMTSVKIG